MLRFLVNNYNEKQLLQIITCLNTGRLLAIDLGYDELVISDISNAQKYLLKLYDKREYGDKCNEKEYDEQWIEVNSD